MKRAAFGAGMAASAFGAAAAPAFAALRALPQRGAVGLTARCVGWAAQAVRQRVRPLMRMKAAIAASYSVDDMSVLRGDSIR